MKRVTVISCILVLLIMLNSGCSTNDNERVSASATAVRLPSGEVIAGDPDDRELASVEEFHQKISEINERFPIPGPLQGMENFKLKEITEEGVIILEDGQMIKMAGIKCTSSGTEMLHKFIGKSAVRISFHEERVSKDGYVESYVWLFNPSLESYTHLNDAVITNKWCEIDPTSQSEYIQRYLALSNL
jgi:hypothetical protein